MDELFLFLSEQTPFLANGFLINIYISVAAMLMGTVLGTLVAIPIARNWRFLRPLSALGVNLSRNVPSFVLMFYVAFFLPNEIVLQDSTIIILPEYKAAIALMFPVLGFAADEFRGLFHLNGSFKKYLNSWMQYFLIILMASVTASVIGADEVLARANRLISTRSDISVLIGTYVYIGLWFILFGLMFTKLIKIIFYRTTQSE